MLPSISMAAGSRRWDVAPVQNGAFGLPGALSGRPAFFSVVVIVLILTTPSDRANLRYASCIPASCNAVSHSSHCGWAAAGMLTSVYASIISSMSPPDIWIKPAY
jgi:hypothetical protein